MNKSKKLKILLVIFGALLIAVISGVGGFMSRPYFEHCDFISMRYGLIDKDFNNTPKGDAVDALADRAVNLLTADITTDEFSEENMAIQCEIAKIAENNEEGEYIYAYIFAIVGNYALGNRFRALVENADSIQRVDKE